MLSSCFLPRLQILPSLSGTPTEKLMPASFIPSMTNLAFSGFICTSNFLRPVLLLISCELIGAHFYCPIVLLKNSTVCLIFRPHSNADTTCSSPSGSTVHFTSFRGAHLP